MDIGKNFRLLLVFLLLFSPVMSEAIIHHLHQSPRAMGMGDAYVAIANDYSAIFYNPAGLARREDETETNLNMDFTGSSNFQSFMNDISAAGGDETQVIEVLNRYNGDAFSLRLAPLNGAYVAPKWGIAFTPLDFSMRMMMHAGFGPTIKTTVYADSTLAISYGDDVRDQYHGRLSWGVTGKFVNRAYMDKFIISTEIASDPNIISPDDLVEGYTIDADIGLLYTPAFKAEVFDWLQYVRPTFGLVIRNVAESGFKNSLKLYNRNEQTEQPEKLYRVIDIGSKWEYPSVFLFSGRGVLDVRDILHPEFSMKKGLHLGFEFDWVVSNWWKGAYRIGMSQGYLTAGISAKLSTFSMDLVTFAEDIGTYTVAKESRQYLLRLNLNF